MSQPETHVSPELQSAALAGLEWPLVLEALRVRIATPLGHRALAGLAPLPKLGAVRHALARCEELRTLRAERGPLGLGGAQALDGLLERASRGGRLEADELIAVLATQRTALQVRAELQSLPDAGTLQELAGAVHPLRELVDTLARAFTPAGALDEAAFPELRRLRAEIGERRDEIHRKLEGLLRASRLADAFQDPIITVRGRRYVLPVKADFKGHLAGIVHDVSSSGATLFIEPQSVVDDTNTLTLTERLLELEVDRILRELSAAVGGAEAELRANLDWIGAVDLAHAQAALSEAYQGTVPRVEAEGVLELKGLAHPLMLLEDTARRGSVQGAGVPGGAPEDDDTPDAAEAAWPEGATAHPPPVRNDVRLGADARCMVISGANTGGKTVLLKAVGLAAVLVRHGMPVPARAGSRCDLFGAVWADIGDQQSLEASLSTFSAQIHALTQWLPRAGAGCLVLLDELLTGTEPAQGAALGAAVLERLLEQGATALVTTHFGELKELAARHDGIVNASMAFDAERLRPTYRLQVGLPGASFALHIARRHGLPEALVRHAEEALAARPAAVDALLVEIHEQQRRLEADAERLGRREGQLRRAEAALEQERSRLAEREREVRRKERGAVGAELRAARRRLREVTRALQEAGSLQTVSKVREQLAELEREHARAGQEGAPPTAAERDAARALGPGDAVRVESLGRSGTLEALLDDGERARVRLGSVSLEVARDDLRPAPKGSRGGRGGKTERGGKAAGAAAAPTAEPGGEADEGEGIVLALSTEDNTLDVRGLRLEEALEQTERFLDHCTMKHISPVMVIHGHGTGRLKLGLREHLRGSPYVSGFRPGEAGEGRDGVTIIALNL